MEVGTLERCSQVQDGLNVSIASALDKHTARSTPVYVLSNFQVHFESFLVLSVLQRSFSSLNRSEN
jgi:hypothetical protein